MRRSSGINVSSTIRAGGDERGRSPGRGTGEARTPARGLSQRERFLSPGGTREATQDAAILQSAFSDDVKIRQGKTLLKPSEIRSRTPGKKRQKDWGECPLTFDSIKEPVRAADGNVYERWAIKKWLEENGNRSPLTNVVIGPELTPLQDSDEGTVRGSRYISPERNKESVKTEINTVLNTVRDSPGMQIDESQYVDAPSGSRTAAAGGASPAADGPGGGDDEQDRNKRIAAVMRDTSLTAAERNAKIQAIRTGNAFSVQAPAGGHDAGDGESNGGGESGGARADAGDAAERNKRIAAVMRDTSLSAAERNAKIQAIRTGNAFAPEAPAPKPPLPRQASGSGGPAVGGDPFEAFARSKRDAPPEPPAAAAPQPPQSDARGAAIGAVKRAQAGLVASGAGSEVSEVQRQKQREDARGKEAEDSRLQQLRSRGFSGFDPSQLAAGSEDLADLTVKTSASAVPRVNIDWGTVSVGHNDVAEHTLPNEPASDTTPPPPPATAATASTNYASSASAVSVPVASNGSDVGRAPGGGGASNYSSAASAVATAPAPSPAASTSKGGGSIGKAGGLMGWMSSSKKEATSAKQLVGRPDIFGEDELPPGIAGHASSDAGPAVRKEEPARGTPSSSASSAAEGLVGVGITFGQFHKDHYHAGALYVKQLQEHGPAMESRMVARGDILYEVDGVNSYRRSIERIQGKILGPVGSWVSLVLKRPAATGSGEAIEALPAVSITLQRRAPPPGHQLGVVEEPRRSRTHDDGARADGGGRGGGQAGAGRETGESVQGSGIQGRSASSKTQGSGQTGGVLDGLRLHDDLLQVLEIQAEKSPVSLFGKDSWSMQDMRQKGELIDMSFRSYDGTTVQAHRLLMAASSPLLRSLVSHCNTQGTSDVSVQVTGGGEVQVTLSDAACTGHAIEALVRFMYAGKLRVEGAVDLVQLFRVARHLQVASLQEAAEDGLLAMLSANTCAHLLVLAKGEGCGRVLDGCHVYALQNFEAVAASSGFVNVDDSLVEALVRSESLVAKDEESVCEALLHWMRLGAAAPTSLRGEKMARHIRFGTMQPKFLHELMSRPYVARSSRLRSYIEQGLAVQKSGVRGQARPLLGKGPVTPQADRSTLGAQPNMMGGGGGSNKLRFAFDSSRSHPNHQILDGGLLAVLREDGDSEHSAMLLPPIPKSGRSYVEFVIENTGTPDCYVQLGVCTGHHDVRGGTPAYQSDSGWCFSCHNGNLLHFDQGSEYSNKFPRVGDRVGLLVDMSSHTLEVFVNSVGQGVMVKGLPDTLYYVVDAGDKGQTIRVLENVPCPPM